MGLQIQLKLSFMNIRSYVLMLLYGYRRTERVEWAVHRDTNSPKNNQDNKVWDN
jgi:hypothetical protein